MNKNYLLLASACFILVSSVSGHRAMAKEVVIDFSSRQMTVPLPVDRDQARSYDDYFSKSFEEPVEPPYKKITFLKQDPPRYVGERVERLLHGVEVDIPPEYDYYGYEIRRYMKSILTPSELQDSIKLTESIADAKRARIIMEYWQRELNSEMKILDEIISSQDVTSRVRTTFRYNETKVSSFIPEMFGWIDRNIDFLEFLQENRGQIFVRYPLYAVPEYEVRMEFLKLYNLREEARKRIIKYSPFRAMVY